MNNVKDLQSLQREVVEWADKVFPGQTMLAKIKHLAREAGELEEAPGNRSETADCLILTLHIASRQNMTADQLVAKAAALDANRGRRNGPSIIEWIVRLVEHAEDLAEHSENADKTALCFMCIEHIAALQGLTPGRLVECGAQKMAINQARSWGEPDGDGIYHHINEEAQ